MVGNRDIRLGGGVDTIKQYMRAALVDDLYIAIVPVLLGEGERLLDGLGVASGALRRHRMGHVTEGDPRAPHTDRTASRSAPSASAW
jgi:dihydrofolate reductase